MHYDLPSIIKFVIYYMCCTNIYIIYCIYWAKQDDLHREELCHTNNLLRTLSSIIYQGNGIEKSIFQSRRAFAANSSLVGHKKSIAYSLLIRSSQYRRNELHSRNEPSKSFLWDRRRPRTSRLCIRLWVSIEMSIVDKRTRLRGGKAARKKNDLTWPKKGGKDTFIKTEP